MSMSAAGQPVQILYVEDDESNVRLVQRITRLRPDAALIVARTGAEALETVGRMAPDLILLDGNLPDMTGAQVLTQLRCLPNGGVPVVIVSGDPRPRDLNATGAIDYLTKPFDIDEFLGVIDRWGRVTAPVDAASTSTSLSPRE